MNHYHILNGDALAERFPKDHILGKQIITRECLMDGPVGEKDPHRFFQARAHYLNAYDEGLAYEKYALPELQKIIDLPQEAAITLWFEEDLFCQVNLWFVCSLLYQKALVVSLAMPVDQLRYGFGGLGTEALIKCFQNKRTLTPIQVNQFALLWFAYRNGDVERLLKLGVQMHGEFPFVMKAIGAHFDRLPDGENPSKVALMVKDLIDEIGDQNFGKVFQAFTKRAPIYGYGDLQFRKIYEQMLAGNASPYLD